MAGEDARGERRREKRVREEREERREVLLYLITTEIFREEGKEGGGAETHAKR